VAGYSLFAIVQLITLYLAGEEWQIDFDAGASLIVSGAITFWFTERYVFSRFDAKKYRTGLEVLLITTGVLLLLNSF
jgi:hypothetical protein